MFSESALLFIRAPCVVACHSQRRVSRAAVPKEIIHLDAFVHDVAATAPARIIEPAALLPGVHAHLARGVPIVFQHAPRPQGPS